MEDELDAAHGVVDALVAAQLALDDLDVVLQAGEVRAVAGREVVEHANGVAALEQRADEVRADEAGAAGDEDPATHAGDPSGSGRTARFCSVSGPDWPGEERRRPPMSSPTWAVRAPLAAWLEEQAAAAGGGYRVLDVGCGPKPYYPFFAERASEYVGVDVVENPVAELRGPVEALPVEDASFDLVLCTQVLEHCDDPAQAVRELRRVTHPADASSLRRTASRSTPFAAGLLAVDARRPAPALRGARGLGVARRPGWRRNSHVPRDAGRHLRRDRAATHSARTRARLDAEPDGRALDGRVRSLREPRPGSLTANFHVVATVASQ